MVSVLRPDTGACRLPLLLFSPLPLLPTPPAGPQDVYGSATKSNNNSWLRRKLYEAVGVAPLKASTKGKARKAASSSASRKSGGHSKDGKARPAKAAAPKARRPSGELPASPQGGMSIFDYSDMLSAGTTASDSEDGCGSHGTFPASLQTSAPGTPRSSLGLPFSAGALFGGQPQLASLTPPAGFVPLSGIAASEPQSPQASGLHWADGLSPAQQPPAATAFLSAASRLLSLEAAADGLSSLPGGSAFKPMELEQVRTGEGRSAAAGVRQPALLWARLLGPGKLCAAAALHFAFHWRCLLCILLSVGATRSSCLHPCVLLPQDGWDAADASAQPWYFGSSLDLGVLGPATLPMECGSSAACEEEDDDIPLLTLDLGGARSAAGLRGGWCTCAASTVSGLEWLAAGCAAVC